MTAKFNIKNERHVRDLTSAAVKAALCEALFSSMQLKEKYDVRVKPGFETACWSYLPPHRMYVGTGIVGRGKESLTEDDRAEYVKSHVRHEFGHAHFTERDSRVIQKELAAIKAPFQLWNLFEDARIEERYRSMECAFNWLEYEDLQFSMRPESMMFAFIQAENDESIVRSFYDGVDLEANRFADLQKIQKMLEEAAGTPKGDALQAMADMLAMGPPEPVELVRAKANALLDRVWTYYSRIIAEPTTLGVFPILKEWLEEFGNPQSTPNRGDEGEEGESDLKLGYELADNKEAREAFEKGTIQVTAQTAGPSKGVAEAKRDDEPVQKHGNVLGATSHPMDLARVEALTKKFRKFFESEVRNVRTSSPQKRISARHYALGRPFYKVKQLEGKACKELFAVVDCSGSMSGHHIEEARIFVASLSRLARLGFVKGHIALSAGRPSRWELYKLPVADDVIARITAFAGAEGLESTIKGNLKLAQQADYTMVYTDGQISDSPIDKQELHRHGVFTWGLYAGDEKDYLSGLQLYFDKVIMRHTAEQLVDAMLLQKK
jgi:hypothetical protein